MIIKIKSVHKILVNTEPIGRLYQQVFSGLDIKRVSSHIVTTTLFILFNEL